MDNLNQVPDDNERLQPTVCVYLGKAQDQSLRYGYPHPSNCCHRVRPAQNVGLYYQETICLTDKHPTCKVYASDWTGPLPEDILGSSKTRHKHRLKLRYRPFIIGLVFIIIAILIFLIAPVITQPAPTPTFNNNQSWLAPSVTGSVTPLPTMTLTATPTEIVEAETPFGPYNHYLVHIGKPGDTIEYLSKKYKVSINVLRKANFSNAAPVLEIGQAVVILPERTDPRGVELLQAVYIGQRMRVDEFVEQYQVEPYNFRQENGLEGAEWLEIGQWVVITINLPTTTPLPFTPTHTQSPTATPTLSARTPTSTPTVTRTPKPTVTATLLPSSRTPSPTVTATPPRPTLTRTPKPTVTFTLIPSSTSITTTKTLVAFTEVEDYTVQSGDYLWKLASKWGTDWQTLAALNDLLEPYIIVPGQVIKKPKITVTPTGTIAATLIVPLTGGQYVVQPGDTLMGLAGMWGIPWQELAAYNGFQPPYVLYSGQLLKIPPPIPTPKLP